MSVFAKPLSALFDQPLHGADVLVHGVALDSRQVQKDDLFLAFAGEARDGHQFIAQAVTNGAAAVALEDAACIGQYPVSYVQTSALRFQAGHIAARFYDYPSRQLRVIGVTGTNGKTSITHYIEQLLAFAGKQCALIGTLGIRYLDQSFTTANTTPDAVMLQQQFCRMVQNQVPFVAMEVSSHALVQGRCNGVQFEGAVFSNLSHDHLDYHATLDDYFAAKAALFSADGLRWAVLNKDDARHAELKRYIAADVNIISYSLADPVADIYLLNTQYRNGAYQASVSVFGQQYPLSTVLQGAFNLSNLLAAIAVLLACGTQAGDVIAAAAQVQPVAGRMQTIANQLQINALVDYAHTPDALANVLANLKPLTSGRLIVVFGCGGDRDNSKRPLMANIAEQYASLVIVTDDNPRSENPQDIHRQIVAGFKQADYRIIADRAEAIRYAVAQAVAGDTLLVAGKGHELYQISGDQKLPFDDAAVLQAALAGKEGAC